MKKFAVVMLSVLTIPAYAQSILGSLQTYQKDIQAKAAATTAPGAPAAKVEPVAKTKTSGLCTEPDQTSLPLAYITAMIMEKDGKLAIGHDARTGKLSVSSPDMISNCAAMVEWVPNTREVDGRKVYSIEAKIKKGEDCVDNVCSYDVAKVAKGAITFEKVKVKATMVGFEQCLEQSGVVKGGKVVEDAIYPSAIAEQFDGYKESGEVLFLSHGPSSKLVKAKYDKFVEVDKCDHYEKITPEGIALRSLQQEESEAYEAEKKKVSECGEYETISDFMERYEQASDELNDVRDKLILEAVKKASKAITEGKYTEEDLKVLADFDKYIVQPKIAEAALSYNKAQMLEGSEKVAEMEYMKATLATLQSYNNVPFISSALVSKLESEGRFNEAALANGMKAIIVSHNRLGAKESGIVITPAVAQQRTQAINQGYGAALEKKKERFEIRTGQVTGLGKKYADETSRLNQRMQRNTQETYQLIQEEYQRMQPGGYCYASPFRNSQKCVQESMEIIAEYQNKLKYINEKLYAQAVESSATAAEYYKLEKEGSDYVARQNGETPPAADPLAVAAIPRADDTQGQVAQNRGNPYDQQAMNFQGQGQAQGQAQMQMQMQGQYMQQPQYQSPYAYSQQGQYMQQQNPYAQQQQYQQPGYMGQQNYNYTGQFNLGLGAQYGQQQYQQPYMQQQSYMPQGQSWQPNTAYSNYSMYGYRQ